MGQAAGLVRPGWRLRYARASLVARRAGVRTRRSMDEAFEQELRTGYARSEPAVTLGFPFLGTETLQGVPVQVAASMVNRHGLIAGATGTGKTKTLQDPSS